MQGTAPDLHDDTLDQTIAALEAGASRLNPETGRSIVDRWHSAVLAEDEVDLGDVAAGLAELRDLLAADALDGGAIGGVLLRLGGATEAAAGRAADARLTPRLQRLATLLTFAGNRLAGPAAPSPSS